jgi:hypothetical protein
VGALLLLRVSVQECVQIVLVLELGSEKRTEDG